MTMLDHDLTVLHEHYIEAVNTAVAHDDFDLVDRLAQEYDAEAMELMQHAVGGRHAA